MRLEQQGGRHVSALCSLLGYTRQAYYQWKRAEAREALVHDLVVQEVIRIRSRQKAVGTRKLYLMLVPFLASHSIALGRDKLFALMSHYGLLIRKRHRKIPRTTFSDHWLRKHPNLIEGIVLTSANKLWVSDITYISLTGGNCYLSLITDAYSHKIVGYYVNGNLNTEGCLKALEMALKCLPKGHSLIHHSDRGCQYCSYEYVEILTKNNVAISMTQHSDPRENAIAERVNGIIKQEFLDKEYPNLTKAKEGIKAAVWIYNNERLHSSIDMLTPAQAHEKTGHLKRHWKNYYQQKEKEAAMT